MYDFRPQFLQDIDVMLYGMSNEHNIEIFKKNNVDLFNFLILDEADLIRLGIRLPSERNRILRGLHNFHRHPFKSKSVPSIPREGLIR